MCNRVGCEEIAEVVVDVGHADIALCGGHFFDCSDGLPQSGKSVRITPEGELLRASVRRDEINRIRQLQKVHCSAKVSCVHVHLSFHHQEQIRNEAETEEIFDDG